MKISHYLIILFINLLPNISGAQQLSESLSETRLWKEVPVICFHHVCEVAPRPNELTISTDAFHADMKILYDSGFHSISPMQLFDYYRYGKPLPPKPFVLTFDDGNVDQWENSISVLDQYNFKAIFFIMTITVGKKNYLNENQIRLLSQWEHYIGSHTWDHQGVNSLKAKDLHWQIEKPTAYLENLTGLPVVAFAYPYGQWNEKLIPELKRYGIKLAFQLTDKPSQRSPLYSIRRLMVSGKWSPATLLTKINATFQLQSEFQFLNPELN